MIKRPVVETPWFRAESGYNYQAAMVEDANRFWLVKYYRADRGGFLGGGLVAVISFGDGNGNGTAKSYRS